MRDVRRPCDAMTACYLARVRTYSGSRVSNRAALLQLMRNIVNTNVGASDRTSDSIAAAALAASPLTAAAVSPAAITAAALTTPYRISV